jgi:porin
MVKNIPHLFLALILSMRVCWAEDEMPTLVGTFVPGLVTARAALEESGLSFQAVITHDLISDVHGGLNTGSRYAMNYDLIADLDTEKAALWSGGNFHFYVLANHGNNDPDITGMFQTASNIQAPDAIKLYEAYYEHSFSDSGSILFGLHNYNSEFNVLQYAGLFSNAAFGIQTDISQATPSIFPTTALATRIRYQPTPNLYVLSAAYDGVAGDPNNARGTHLQLNRADGFFYGLEGGTVATTEEAAENYYKLAWGAWYKTSDAEDVSGNFVQDNYGIYLIGEHSLCREDDVSQGLGIFSQLGYAPADRNTFDSYYSLGLNYVGLIPGRNEDSTGLAINLARHSSDFLDHNPEFNRAETVLEFSHRIELTPYLALQPDLQYVWNPAGDPAANNALILLTRVIAKL